jgi:uncharacterized protein Yka (UPF0111/DUF47 family)
VKNSGSIANKEDISSANENIRFIDELNKTFITPFEREDIFNLSRTLDDMLDYASSTYEEMCIFKLKPTEDLHNMFELIYRAAEYIDSAIKYLKNNPAISSEQALNAKKAENKIETKYREFLNKLFMEDDIKYILKMREIFRHLSNLADKIDSTSDTICNIVVKII